MTLLKIGLAGCGCIGQLVHLPILTRLRNVQIVALADTDPRHLEEALRLTPRATPFADYREMVEMPGLEAVVICLPNALHAQAAIAAMQRGRHVYLEKPLAVNLNEGQKVLEAWADAGTVGMIGFNYRLNRLYQAVKRHTQSGRLGKLIGARSVFSIASQDLPDWKRSRKSGGGVLLDLASHHIDLFRFLFDEEVKEVYARVRSIRTEEDSALLELCLSNGLMVQSFFSLHSAIEDRLEIYGNSGKLAVDRHLSLDVQIADPDLNHARLKRCRDYLRSLAHVPYLFTKLRSPAHEPSFRAALTHFISSVRNHQAATPDFWDGYRTLEVISAAEESMETGRAVFLMDPARQESKSVR